MDTADRARPDAAPQHGPEAPRPGAARSTTDTEAGTPAASAAGDSGMETGTYEVLRDRLSSAARELADRAHRLNDRRVAAFGGSRTELAGTDLLRTADDRVPRDLVQIGGLLLVGYTGRSLTEEAGAGTGDGLRGVLALYRRARQHERNADPETDGDLASDGESDDADPDGDAADGARFQEVGPDALPGLLDDPRFRRDFDELHRYYRAARLSRLHRTGDLLLAVFTTGDRLTDIRVLRWRIAADGIPSYLDSKGERDYSPPAPYDLEWTTATRGDHRLGRHPHVAIDDTVYVSTVGGELTVKVTDDTESADGIYREPVDEPLQALADADIEHARVGPLVVLRVRPYNEGTWRHLVFHTRTQDVRRLDGIGQGYRRLPDDQGIVFPGGYYLAGAPAGSAARTFDTDTTGLGYQRTVRSPNGEDVLYVFGSQADGRTLLLPYNVIREEAAAPVTAHGYALFDDGTMAVLRPGSGEATRVHAVQLWRTPYSSDSHAAARLAGGGPLSRVGNADLVRTISDCLSVTRMADPAALRGGEAAATPPTSAVFEAIATASARVADTCHWLDDDGLGDLGEPLRSVTATARQVVGEFERVAQLRQRATEAVTEATERVTALSRRVRGEQPDTADGWVRALTDLRQAGGRLETLRELRYADTDRIDELTTGLNEDVAATGRRALAFLSGEDAFTPTRRAVDELADDAARVGTTAETEPLAEAIDAHAEGLAVVTEVVSGLDGADPTARTDILSRAGEVLGAVNRARATLQARRRELLDSEGRAEFAAEFALLGQAVAGGLAASGTPQECDEQLGRLLLRLENLEARFGAYDDFLEQIAAEREEVYETFSARKQAQLDERARRADRLAGSAARVLDTIARRAAALSTPDEVNTYFGTDPLVAKVRATAEELRAVGDPVRADELDGRIAAARQEAGRALRDRTDLYDEDGTGTTIRLGRHRFAVNTQPLDLTLVPHDGGLAFAITGTDYRAAVRGHSIERYREFWSQPLVSESPEVYRSEHLAATLLAAAEAGERGLTVSALRDGTPADLTGLVRDAAQRAWDEGYDRGVHDVDAARILAAVLRLRDGAGLLSFPPRARAAAQLFWAYGADETVRARWATRARSLGRARAAFGATSAVTDLAAELSEHAAEFAAEAGLVSASAGAPVLPVDAAERAATGRYLFEELALDGPRFATGAGARSLLDGFWTALGGTGSPTAKEFASDLHALGDDLAARHQLVLAWLGAYTATHTRGVPPASTPEAAGTTGAGTSNITGTPADQPAEATPAAVPELPEAVAVELCGTAVDRRDVSAPLTDTVDGLLGEHPRIATGGNLPLRLDEFLARTEAFRTHRVPAHRAYTRERSALLDAERQRLGLDAYRPEVMSAFVRNRLIDEVYLPLIGDNFAAQLGAAGAGRRTDSQGMLLLLSPPGYGKTTLMEYVAARLGLVFVKVDGPALGHRTTSLDPDAAPDAAARREVAKIGLALEMGNNVLLHLDDIQHTSPELLQKFIPLCDAQRRVDGAWEGQPRSWDLRGKRFAVSMAGNPYTESGQRFRLPDMLANRADVWNLGDVLSGKDDVFALSHLENALTAHPVLAPVASRDRSDIDLLARLAGGDREVAADHLSHPYSAAELEEVLAVLTKLLRVRETVLTVNRAYIASAAQSDDSRTEPPFLLQGSYRDTNRIAARIVPAMNDDELQALIDDHYRGEAQTLTSGAEANLLKLGELRGTLTAEQEHRWSEVKEGYRRGHRPLT